jgi:hypothetical protein
MKFTEKEEKMITVIEENFTQFEFGIQEIKTVYSEGTVVVLANLAKKGVLKKTNDKPAKYIFISENQRVEVEALISKAAKVVELETGMVYGSAAEAMSIKGAGYSKIKDAVRGARRIAGGSHWCRLDDMPINFTIEDCKKKIEIIDASFGYFDGVKVNRGKRVRNIELNQEFYSAAEAARFYNLSCDSVAAACRGDVQTAGGYHWEYVEEDA